MASIDGGTLASQKELKCQINSVRAPNAQEFLYVAPWEADKDRLCVSEQALTKHQAFFTRTTSASSFSSFCCHLNDRAGASLLMWPGQTASVLHTFNFCIFILRCTHMCLKKLITRKEKKSANKVMLRLGKEEFTFSQGWVCCSAVIWYACGEPH